MVELSHRDRTIKVKIVYYGPPVGGKTTNLQVLHQRAAAERRGEMISINSAQDRTILFDLLPLRTGGLRGFDLRLQILAVPGQAMYATTRRLVLKGADSLVFVANSAADRWEENLQSFREMTQNLVSHRLDPSTMPLVFQYNKRDLPEVTDIEMMDRALNGRSVDRVAAVAVRGEGVLETFAAVLTRTVEDVCRRYAILDARGGQPAQQWTQQAIHGLFGAQTLAGLDHPAAEAQPPITPHPGVSVPVAPSPSSAAPPPAAVTPPRPPAPAPAPPPPVPARAAPPPAGSPPAEKPAAPPPPPPPKPAEASPPRGTPAPPSVAAAEAAFAEMPTRRITPVLGVKAAVPTTPVEPPTTAPPPTLPPAHRKVRVAPQPEEIARAPSGPDARASETLVESYAEASEQLSSALNDLREERDAVRRRLEDLQKTLVAAQDILAGRPLQLSLETVLRRMAESVGVTAAAFLLPQAGRPPIAAAVCGAFDEPLLRVPGALRQVVEAASGDAAPRLYAAADGVELARALEGGEAHFAAVLVVPFRTPRGLHGLATLYFPRDAALPSAGGVTHLGEMARALSTALELASTLETSRGAERALEMALAGTAALRGLEDVVAGLQPLRDGLAAMRRRPDAPAWLQQDLARLAPSLQATLGAARSFLGFSRGQIHHEKILVEELLAPLRAAHVSTQIEAGAETVSGDPALLRVALRSLVDHLRGPAAEGSHAPGVVVRAEPAGARVILRLSATDGAPRAGSSPSLTLARRIVELHGGALTTQAVPGAADVLVLSLPPR